MNLSDRPAPKNAASSVLSTSASGRARRRPAPWRPCSAPGTARRRTATARGSGSSWRQRVGVVLLVELHQLLGRPFPVALVPLLDLLDLRLQHLHGCASSLICLTNSGISRIRMSTTRPTMARHQDQLGFIPSASNPCGTEHDRTKQRRRAARRSSPGCSLRARELQRAPSTRHGRAGGAGSNLPAGRRSCRRYFVDAAVVPGVAPHDPARGQPSAAQRPVHAERLVAVVRARRVEPADAGPAQALIVHW